MKKLLVLLVGITTAISSGAQNVSTRTNEFQVDMSDPKRVANSIIPVIKWITPTAESNYAADPKFKIKFEIESTSALKNITIAIKESVETASRGMLQIEPTTEAEKHVSVIERNLTLMDGVNIIEVVAENIDGVKTVSQRTVTVGTTAMADASKLDRTDYAILFTTYDYVNWPELVNPVNDGRMIADELKKIYGYKVEIVEGGSQSDILKKLREYAEKKI